MAQNFSEAALKMMEKYKGVMLGPRILSRISNLSFRFNAPAPHPAQGQQWVADVNLVLQEIFAPSGLSTERIRLFLDQLTVFHNQNENYANDFFELIILLTLATLWTDLPNFQMVKIRFNQMRPQSQYPPLTAQATPPLVAAELSIQAEIDSKMRVGDANLTPEQSTAACNGFAECMEVLGLSPEQVYQWARHHDDGIGKKRGANSVVDLREYWVGTCMRWRMGRSDVLADRNMAYTEFNKFVRRSRSKETLNIYQDYLLDSKYIYDGTMFKVEKKSHKGFLKDGRLRGKVQHWTTSVMEKTFKIATFNEIYRVISPLHSSLSPAERTDLFSAIYRKALEDGYQSSYESFYKMVVVCYDGIEKALRRRSNGIGKYWTSEEEYLLSSYLIQAGGKINLDDVCDLIETRSRMAIKSRIEKEHEKILKKIDDLIQEDLDEDDSDNDVEFD